MTSHHCSIAILALLLLLQQSCTRTSPKAALADTDKSLQTAAVNAYLAKVTSGPQQSDEKKTIYFVDVAKLDLAAISKAQSRLDIRDHRGSGIFGSDKKVFDVRTGEEGTLIERVETVYRDAGVVRIEVYWFNQALAAGIYEVEFRLNDGEWIVVRVDSIAVS